MHTTPLAMAIKPFTAPQRSETVCRECGRGLPAVYFGPTNWPELGYCNGHCWARDYGEDA